MLEAKKAGCPKCGGALHSGFYPRKPRGGPSGLPEEYKVRFSLCCSKEGCRKRVLPKSVLFDGRRVYFRMVILMTILLREQRSSGVTMRQIQEKLEVDCKTIRRWQKAYQEDFREGRYRNLKSHFALGLSEGQELPGIFSMYQQNNGHVCSVIKLLQFLAENEGFSPGVNESPQKMGTRKIEK